MKKILLWLLLVATAFMPGPARAAQVVLVISSQDPQYLELAAGFRSAFEREFTEINLEGSDEKQRIVGEQLKAKPPAAAVVVGDLAAQMAKWYLPGVPLVYCASPRAAKINLTTEKAMGIYHETGTEAQLKALKSLFPDRTRVGLIYCPEFVSLSAEGIRDQARSLGVTLEVVPMGSVKDVPAKLAELLPRVQALWVLTDPVVLSTHSIQYIVLQAITAKVPILCGDPSLARGGATAGLVPDMKGAGAQAAQEAAKILVEGAPSPGSISYPPGVLILNQKTAVLLGVVFPPARVGEAQEVIQ